MSTSIMKRMDALQTLALRISGVSHLLAQSTDISVEVRAVLRMLSEGANAILIQLEKLDEEVARELARLAARTPIEAVPMVQEGGAS